MRFRDFLKIHRNKIYNNRNKIFISSITISRQNFTQVVKFIIYGK